MSTKKCQTKSLLFGIILMLANSPVILSGAGQTVTTTFTVTIPFWTPETESIYLTGSAVALGANFNPAAVPLSKINQVTWTGTVALNVDEPVTYRYTRGTENSQSKRRIGFTVTPSDSARFDAVIE
jgi:hypothetical protein